MTDVKKFHRYDKFTVERHGDYWILDGSYAICPECDSTNLSRESIIALEGECPGPDGLKVVYECRDCGCILSAERRFEDSI